MEVEKEVKEKEAQRRGHLQPEVVYFEVLDKAAVEEIEKNRDVVLLPAGAIEVGLVLVINRHGASWTMTVEDFDAEYKAR